MPRRWDGMYGEQVPYLQTVRCLKSPLQNQGGQTLFRNTISALASLDNKTKAQLRETFGTYEISMAFYKSKTISPLITKHPLTNQELLQFNELYDPLKGKLINPPQISFEGKENISNLSKALEALLYHPEYLYKHQWQTNDIVIADNFSILHGREAFKSNAPRHIQRVQVLTAPVYNNPHLISYR